MWGRIAKFTAVFKSICSTLLLIPDFTALGRVFIHVSLANRSEIAALRIIRHEMSPVFLIALPRLAVAAIDLLQFPAFSVNRDVGTFAQATRSCPAVRPLQR